MEAFQEDEPVESYDSEYSDGNSKRTSHPFTPSGNYHCKSALRSHEDNIKLALYRRDYLDMKNASSGTVYDDQYLKVLGRIWETFSNKVLDFDGIFNPPRAIADTRASDPIIQYFRKGEQFFDPRDNILREILLAENKVLSGLVQDHEIQNITAVIKEQINKYIHLLFFITLTTTAMNHEKNERVPQLLCGVPGVLWSSTKSINVCEYNKRFYIKFNKTCVELIVGNYRQIVQRDFYLNLADKIQERVNIIISSMMRDIIWPHLYTDVAGKRVLLTLAVSNIIKFGDEVIKALGNHGFELIGKYEAFVVSAILTQDSEDLWNVMEFQENLLKDDVENAPYLVEYSKQLCKMLNSYNAHILAELHGIWRIWGHPIIDLIGGLKKMEKTSLNRNTIDIEETKIGGRTFKMTFLCNYRKVHSFYPLTNVSAESELSLYENYLSKSDKEIYQNAKAIRDKASSYIIKCIRDNKPIIETTSTYNHEDWDEIELLQNFQTPATVNLATMIKDKAISMDRDELLQAVHTRKSVFDSEKRRGVLKWLKKQTIGIKQYLKDIDTFGIDDNECIIGLYPKEREIKIKARFFSLMSYTIRMFVTITEELIGNHILKYFPMITMSDTLLSMMIRLYNMTTPIGRDGDNVTYCMNIDFSKWNQNMREATNDCIFPHIDRLLGYRRLISRTHEIFKKCYIYLCSGEYIPTIIQGMLTVQSPFSRIGDESGKEGLRQKGWTITTVCDILSLSYKHRVKIELIGGGDNQVLTVTIRPNIRDKLLEEKEMLSTIKSRMESFRKDLAKKMEKRGLPLKLEETWISHRLLMYNKIMYLDGVPLSSTLKVASRCFSYSNEGIMTLGNITSTLGTNFQSISSKDYTPAFAWLFSRYITGLWMSMFFMVSPITGSKHLDTFLYTVKFSLYQGLSPYGRTLKIGEKKETKKNKKDRLIINVLSLEELLIISIYYHKVLGGPGIGSPHSYMIKGFPDPLSEALAFNYQVIDVMPNQRLKAKIKSITMVNKREDKKWEHLLEDPVSINHDVPMTGLAALRVNAENILRTTDIQNEKFKALLSIGDNEILKDLSNNLCSPPVLEPRLLHDIVSATIPGYVNSITAKVDQSSTLNKLSSSTEVVESVYEKEVLYYLFLGEKIRSNKGHSIGRCPTEDAKKLRNWTWDKQIVGVTVPHPSAFLYKTCHFSDSGECDMNYIMVQVKTSPQNFNKRGTFRPYFGSYTKEKFKQHALATAYGDENILRRAIKIQKLLKWRYDEGSMMYNIIQQIIRCVTNTDPNKFLPIDETITGDVEHRYNDQSTKHGGIPCNLTQLYTLASCNTSTFINHSRGSMNENIHFQSCIIYSCMLSILDSIKGQNCTKVYHFHESCSFCITKLEHPDDKDTEPRVSISLYGNKDNDLIYVREEDVPIHFHIAKKLFMGTSVSEDAHMTILEQQQLLPTLCSMFVCTLMVNQTGLTDSSTRIMLGKLNAPMLLSALFCYFIYWSRRHDDFTCNDNVLMIKKIMEFVNEHRDQLMIILKSELFFDILLAEKKLYDMRVSLSQVDLDMEISLLLQEFFKRTPLTDIKDSVPSIQDPMMIYMKAIYMISNNKSINCCNICRFNWIKYMREGKAHGFGLCKKHGALNTCKKFHMYSLDKLSKDVTSSNILDMDMDKGQQSVLGYDNMPSYPRMTFKKYSINGESEENIEPAIFNGIVEDASQNKFMKEITLKYGTILYSINHLMARGQELNIAISCPLTVYEIKVLDCAIRVLHKDNSLNDKTLKRITLFLSIDDYRSLEGDMLVYAQKMSVLMTDNKHCYIKVPFLYEKHLDTTWVLSQVNFSIVDSFKYRYNIMVPILMMVYSDDIERTFRAESVINGYKVSLILTDEKLPGDPFLGLLIEEPCQEICSYNKFLDVFRDHVYIINQFDYGVCHAIMSTIWRESMVLGFLREVVPCVSSVMRSSDMHYYIKKLSNIIRDNLMFNRREGLYNWRVTMAFKIIISLRARCSVHKVANRRFLLNISGMNFVRGSNKQINVVRSVSKKRNRFGHDLVSIFNDINDNMNIEYESTFEIKRCRRIMLL